MAAGGVIPGLRGIEAPVRAGGDAKKSEKSQNKKNAGAAIAGAVKNKDKQKFRPKVPAPLVVDEKASEAAIGDATPKASDAPIDGKAIKRRDPETLYEELRHLGSGAFGAAVLVRRKKDGKRLVAKKCCVANLPEKQRAMCLEEIALLRKVRHPYIAEIVDFLFSSEDRLNYWVVLKYYSGGDVQAEIEKCKEQELEFATGRLMNWISQLCQALQHCHALNIVHRDVKGANLFVTGTENIVLGDFGVSKQLDVADAKAMTDQLKESPGDKVIRDLIPGEIMDLVEWQRTSRSALGVTRIRCKARNDGACGWVTFSDAAGLKALEAV